jgi:hypothetical protein
MLRISGLILIQLFRIKKIDENKVLLFYGFTVQYLSATTASYGRLMTMYQGSGLCKEGPIDQTLESHEQQAY